MSAKNGITNPNRIYVGQRLRIPGKSSSSSSGSSGSTGGTATKPSVYVVRRGETLASIARRYGTSVAALVRANGIANPNRIYVGQRIRLSGSGASGGGSSPPASGKKQIEVDLSSQRLYAKQGDTVVRRMVISTGISRYPTPTGRFRIQSKVRSTHMSGPGYSLPNVPHAMFFYRGYALHGTYWHNNFGRPMSHGCINLTRADAAWLYKWAPKGTQVVIHR